MNKNLYEKLRSRVYEILYPEGTPLEVGCDVSVFGKTHILLSIGRSGILLSDGIKYPKRTIKAEGQNHGKPLSLQDLLRAIDISRSRYSRNCLMFSNGWLMISSDGKLVRLIQLDLSLPIPKQEKRVLEVLIELLD